MSHRLEASEILARAASDLSMIVHKTQDEFISELWMGVRNLEAMADAGFRVFAPGLEFISEDVHNWFEELSSGGRKELAIDSKFGVILCHCVGTNADGEYSLTARGRV